jgi:ATP-binding cassette, subfamily B, bacterial
VTSTEPSWWQTLRATLALVYRSQPRAFVISAVASLTEPLFYPALLLLLQRLVTHITGPGGSVQFTPTVEAAGIGIVAALLIQRLGIIVRDATATVLRQEAWVTISKRIMAKLPEVPYSLFENNAFQAQYGLVIREASQRSITLVDALISTVPIFFGLLGVAVTLFTIAPLMVLALVAIAFPAARIEQRFSHAMYELQEHTAPGQLRMDALINMQVDAPWQRDVRTYRSDLLAREHGQLADTYLNNLKRLTAKFLGLRSAAALVQVAGFALAIVVAFVLLRTGNLSLPQLVILLPGIPLLSGMINSFIGQFRSLLESLRYAQTLFTFLAATSFGEVPAALPPPLVQRSRLAAIQTHAVSYIYPETQQVALAGISHAFTPGLTAIVGTNGAGKSTLVKLIAGLVPPTTGTVQALDLGGEMVPVDACAKAVLFQDPGHFPFSIRHNVTMQADHDQGDDARIWTALEQAGLHDLVAGLPDGLDTIVGAGFGGATDLSGGQWQRLALARLLYHDTPLIVLDEPSASLDPIGERQIFALLKELAHEKIILFTTHRYDTIRQADTIVVLVDGHIAEAGTPEELEQKAGAFWSLYFGQGSSASAISASARSGDRPSAN